MNTEIFIEYDNNNLSNLSDKLYNLFKNNKYQVSLLSNELNTNEKINIIKKNNNKKFIIINKENSRINSIEIIYSLRDNDILAKELSNNLGNTIDKYYQLRSPINTNLDYYELLRNINNNQGIVIKYGKNYLNNDNIIYTIYNTINKYLNEENIYIVKMGDSLYSIAKKFNISVNDLIKSNNLSTNNISIGQKLIIPEIINQNNNQNDNNNNTYTVKSGDSLYAIAKKFNTSVDAIKKLNNLSSNNLSINQILLIPNNQNDNSNNTYTVKSGDSLYAIAKKFNTSVDAIKKLNNLSSNNLSINQILLIPNGLNNNSNNTYTVKSGDSLYAIARKFNTSVDAIKKSNNLSSNNLSINQILLIPNN